MTIHLEVGKTYRDRENREVGPLICAPDDRYPNHPFRTTLEPGNLTRCWRADGSWHNEPGVKNHMDLVEEVTTSPVRQVTITQTEIVPGTYGRIAIRVEDTAVHGQPTISVRWVNRLGSSMEVAAMNAAELDALAQTATQLAAALRQIASEQNT